MDSVAAVSAAGRPREAVGNGLGGRCGGAAALLRSSCCWSRAPGRLRARTPAWRRRALALRAASATLRLEPLSSGGDVVRIGIRKLRDDQRTRSDAAAVAGAPPSSSERHSATLAMIRPNPMDAKIGLVAVKKALTLRSGWREGSPARPVPRAGQWRSGPSCPRRNRRSSAAAASRRRRVASRSASSEGSAR